MVSIDYGIIAFYFMIVISLGFWYKKRASKNLDSYFLAGKNIHWLPLAMSGSVSTFDITGTMWIVSILFVLGMKSMWHHWMWGVFMAAFFMAYMGKWVRRSNVMTAAEWMQTRFGDDKGGRLARTTYALMATPTWRDGFDDFSGLDLPAGVSNVILNGQGLVLASAAITGSAVSRPITPTIAIVAWGDLTYTCAVDPPTTTLSVDVLSVDGSEVLANVASGANLASIDPAQYPALELRANLSSTVAGETCEACHRVPIPMGSGRHTTTSGSRTSATWRRQSVLGRCP